MSQPIKTSVLLGLSAIVVGSFSPQAMATNHGSEIPAEIQAPKDQKLILRSPAQGVQIYTCKASLEDANQFVWTFKAPEAVLQNPQRAMIGSHYAGPTWLLRDRSKVVGTVTARFTPTNPNDIPLLLLKATPDNTPGLLQNVTWIQRLKTKGGQAPKTGCNRETENKEFRSFYTADYYFYAPVMTTPVSPEISGCGNTVSTIELRDAANNRVFCSKASSVSDLGELGRNATKVGIQSTSTYRFYTGPNFTGPFVTIQGSVAQLLRLDGGVGSFRRVP
jgi:hypothetical protein